MAMTEAERAYEKIVGVAPDDETAVAVGLVWAIEHAGTLLDRVKIAKEALDKAAEEAIDRYNDSFDLPGDEA